MADASPNNSKSENQNKGDPLKEVSALDKLSDDLPDSLDELGIDEFLKNVDPELINSLNEVSKDKELIALDINLSDQEQELAEEKEIWANSKGLKKIIYKVFRFAPHVSLKVKKIKYKLFTFARAVWVRVKNFSYYLATDGKTKFIEKFKSYINRISTLLSQIISGFKKRPLKYKLLAVTILALVVVTGIFIYKSLTLGVIHEDSQLFIPSIASVANQTYEYDPEDEVEPFYDNLRSNQNLFLLKKIIVNLKAGEQASRNPMGVFEFIVEGMIPEVIVEIKDREAAFTDLVQRTIEEYTFEFLDTSEGKTALCERIKSEINSLLTTGTVKKILIKNIVIKP